MIVQLFDPTWYLSESGGFSLFGNILFGSNGTAPWMPELSAGTTTASAEGRTQWDQDLDNGFDTDEISVDFDADLADGSVEMLVGSESLSLDGGSSANSTVGSVRIVARSSANGAVQWGDLTVTFWDGSTVVETTDVSGPQAWACNSPTGEAEQALVITPTSSSVDRVTVCGAFRMFAYDAPLDPASLFGQILIIPA